MGVAGGLPVGAEDDFSGSLAGFEAGVGGGDLTHGEDLIDEGSESALMDEGGDVAEDGAKGVPTLAGEEGQSHEDGVEGGGLRVEGGEVSGGPGGDGDGGAAGADLAEGVVEVGSADGVDDGVKGGFGGVPAEDDVIGTEVTGEGGFDFSGNGSGDMGTGDFGELEGEVADAAGGSVDEDALAGADAGAVDDREPGGDGDQGEGGGVFDGNGCGSGGGEACVDSHEFGKGSPEPFEAAGAGPDAIADFPISGSTADGFDGADDIAVEDSGQIRGECGECSGAQFGINGIHGGGFDAEEEFAAGGDGVGDGAGLELFRSAELAEEDGAHGPNVDRAKRKINPR